MSDTAIVVSRLDKAELILRETTDLFRVLDIKSVAEAVQVMSRSAAGRKHAACIALRATRRAGDILESLQRDTLSEAAQKPRTAAAAAAVPVSEYRKTLLDAQIPERTARQWRAFAAIPESVFESYLQTPQTDLTMAGAARADAAITRKYNQNADDNPKSTKRTLPRGVSQKAADLYQKKSDKLYGVLSNKTYEVASVTWAAFRGMKLVNDRFKVVLYLSTEEIKNLPIRRKLHR